MNVALYKFMWQVSTFNMPWSPRGREGVLFYPFLNLGTRSVLVVTVMSPVALCSRKRPGMHCTRGWLAWASGSVWTVTENLSHTGVRALNRVSGSWMSSLVFAGLCQNETLRASTLTWTIALCSHCCEYPTEAMEKFNILYFGFINYLFKVASLIIF